MNQIYHPYNIWEDYLSGMWRKIGKDEEKDFLEKAIIFTGNHVLYGQWMIEVINKWKHSCEHNLTDFGQNRKAWVGHAACQMAINCPEYITRSAWGYLTKDQQDFANDMADKAIRLWESKNGIKRGHYEQELFEY